MPRDDAHDAWLRADLEDALPSEETGQAGLAVLALVAVIAAGSIGLVLAQLFPHL